MSLVQFIYGVSFGLCYITQHFYWLSISLKLLLG